MVWYVDIAFAFICIFYVIPNASLVGECREDINSKNGVTLIISSMKNETGRWVTDFSLSKDQIDDNADDNVELELSQEVTESNRRKIFRIRGILSGPKLINIPESEENLKSRLLFHTKCGTNVAVLNSRRTVRKINLEESANGVVFTNRPLKFNEVLEVKLEKLHNKFTFHFAIGVTTLSPEEVSISSIQHINSIKNTSWAWYNVNTYRDGKENVKNYGKDLNSLKVGDRVGVMRSNTGSLHFYWNGVDQGPAASNIPQTVYGLVELYGNAAMATIVGL